MITKMLNIKHTLKPLTSGFLISNSNRVVGFRIEWYEYIDRGGNNKSTLTLRYADKFHNAELVLLDVRVGGNGIE